MTTRILCLLTLLAAICAPVSARANCQGNDLSAGWSAITRSEVARRSAAVPYPEGRYWEVTRDGASSVLFGTIHLAEDDVSTPPPALLERLRTAEELLVEVTVEEERRLMRGMVLNPRQIMIEAGPRLSEVIPAEVWTEIVGLTEPYGIGAEAAEQIRPWYLAMTLNTPACTLAYIATGQQILDRRIEAMATELGVPVTGLETPEELFALFDAMPFDEQVEMLTMSVPTAAMAEDYLATTKALYMRGEIQQILEFGLLMTEAEFGAEAASRAADGFLGTLLTERNRRWMEVLVPKLAQGNRVVAVGALHLPGTDGLLALLEAEGFALRRLPD